MKMRQLHEEFISAARKPMSFGRLPVLPREADVPLIPSSKWINKDKMLKKSYQFRLKEQKVIFVKELLDYETEIGHNAKILIEEDRVTLTLQTLDIEQVTELDMEYAKHADVLFKDVVYSLSHDE